MANNFQLKETNDFSLWDSFIEQSPQGTIFSTSLYLKKAGCSFKLLVLFKGSTIVAGIPLIIEKERDVVLNDLIIYGGILFAPIQRNQNFSQVVSDQFEITEFIIAQLTQQYDRIEMALSPVFQDMRPILWLNYFEEAQKKFKCDLRYTSYVDLTQLDNSKEEEKSSLFKLLGYSRRQELRHARRDKSFAQQGDDVQVLLDLYESTLDNQGQKVCDEKIVNMKRIVEELLKQKKGYLFFVKNNKDEVSNAAFFCHDLKRSYFLFGANHPKEKESYSGTVLLWDAFKFLKEQGIKEVDLEGVNSPKRGWFKLGLGGNLLPYYEICWKK